MWDEDAMGRVIHEWNAVRLTAGALRGKLSGIRYIHLISGYGDISKAGRIECFILNAIERRDRPNSISPLPSGLIQWIYGNMVAGSSTAITKTVWCALITGCRLLLRGIELARLRRKGVTLGIDGRGERFAISIASPKLVNEE